MNITSEDKTHLECMCQLYLRDRLFTRARKQYISKRRYYIVWCCAFRLWEKSFYLLVILYNTLHCQKFP
jgi:hypothetical protein